MAGDQQRMLGALQSAKNLGRNDMAQQINAHAAALAMARDYVSTGQDANLRRVAQVVSPLIEPHLEMARRTSAKPF